MPATITATMLKWPVAASTPATGMITSLGKGTPQLLISMSASTMRMPPLVTHWPITPPIAADCGLRCREYAAERSVQPRSRPGRRRSTRQRSSTGDSPSTRGACSASTSTSPMTARAGAQTVIAAQHAPPANGCSRPRRPGSSTPGCGPGLYAVALGAARPRRHRRRRQRGRRSATRAVWRARRASRGTARFVKGGPARRDPARRAASTPRCSCTSSSRRSPRTEQPKVLARIAASLAPDGVADRRDAAASASSRPAGSTGGTSCPTRSSPTSATCCSATPSTTSAATPMCSATSRCSTTARWPCARRADGSALSDRSRGSSSAAGLARGGHVRRVDRRGGVRRCPRASSWSRGARMSLTHPRRGGASGYHSSPSVRESCLELIHHADAHA